VAGIHFPKTGVCSRIFQGLFSCRGTPQTQFTPDEALLVAT